MPSKGADGSVLCMWHLMVLVLTWPSAVLALQLGLDDVKTIIGSPFVDTCNGFTQPLANQLSSPEYVDRRCFCDKECHLFGECCIDRAVGKENPPPTYGDGQTSNPQDQDLSQDKPKSDVRGEIQETTEVLGIPRDRWGCQNLVITTEPKLPTKKVRMVVKCPADTSAEMFQMCEAALDRNSSDFHYSMDIPVLSLASRIWYRNVYCAICNKDVANLAQLTYHLQCQQNYTKEEVLQEGQYSKQPLEWIMPGPEESKCQLKTELQPGDSPGFLRPCGIESRIKNLVFTENCPSNWTDHTTAQICEGYAFYSKSLLNTIQSSANNQSAVLTQVFKNPHCALCNGVPPLNTTRWQEITSRHGGVASLAIVMKFDAWVDKTQHYRSCRPPGGVWDVLHETCKKLTNEDTSGGTFNQTCPLIILATSEYRITENGSLQYIGNNSHYVGHIFDEFEIADNESAIVCAIDEYRATDDLVSGAAEVYLTVICLSISIFCLILHVGIYYALPKRSNLPSKNLLSLSWALLLAQFLFLVGAKPVFEVPLEVCIGIAVVVYFCFLAAFFWMNVMSVDIWRTFAGSVFRGSDGSTTHIKYAVYAWGTSALLTLVALIVDLCTGDGAVKPCFGMGQYCWFGNPGGLAVFLTTPMFILLMVNSGLFVSTVYKIWQTQRQGLQYIQKRGSDVVRTSFLRPTDGATRASRGHSSNVTGRKNQTRFYLYLKLFTIMGLTWIFGFIAVFARVQFMWYLFIVLNGLQGAFIFVMFDWKRKIGYMLWDKYVKHHGYETPGFLMTSSSSASARTTISSMRKSRESASAGDKSDPLVAKRRSATHSGSHLLHTATQ